MSAWIVRLHVTDSRLLHAVLARRVPALDRVFGPITHLGGATATIAAAIFLAFGAVPGLETAGMIAAANLIVTHMVVQLVKRSAARPRPSLQPGLAALAHAPDRFSFPSGHAAAAMAVALPVAFAMPWPVAAAVLLLAMAVGFSRCYLGVHFPGDVAAGWLIALATAPMAHAIVLG